MQIQISTNKIILNRGLLVTVVSYAYVLVFLYASVYKLLDYRFFVAQLKLSPLLGAYATPLAWLVPLLEIACSGLLLFEGFRRLGLLLSSILMGIFTLYIGYILLLSPMVPCSCGGILATMGWRDHLIFNSFFVAAGLWAYFLTRPKQ